MKKQVYNPYLPLYEYIPDGEPHIFNNRLYVYGSHDKFGAFEFCENDYVTYSAPLDDLSDWRYEGVIYKKDQDPSNKKSKKVLFAPDVVQGPDGNFYLYYGLHFSGYLGVAKSPKPNGPFEFLSHVKYKDGDTLGLKKKDIFQFDPGVLVDDDNRIYLYSGFGPDKYFPQIKNSQKTDGCYVYELDKDMFTVIKGPIKVMDKKGLAKDKSVGHEFFEASSIRKINGKYYLIYSSINGHELCYAISSSPFGPFEYKGTLISNGDVYLNGRKPKDALYPLGNNHGGLVKIQDKWYIFYHRHTNYTNTDRQGMAEEIFIDNNGLFKQVEKTSCGLNEGPLKGKGVYPSSICSTLIPKKGNAFYPFFKIFKSRKTYITQSTKDEEKIESQYIRNIRDGCLIGYKYFDLSNTTSITLNISGCAKGKIGISFSEKENPQYFVNLNINNKRNIKQITIEFPQKASKTPIFLNFALKSGKLNFYSFELK